MSYTRSCKCGNYTTSGDRSHPQCSACAKCGTVPHIIPQRAPQPIPHYWVMRYEQHTGQEYQLCLRCQATRAVPLPTGWVRT
jgi:hypothetical protein